MKLESANGERDKEPADPNSPCHGHDIDNRTDTTIEGMGEKCKRD